MRVSKVAFSNQLTYTMFNEYTAIVVMLLATFLPKLGVTIANDALTTFVSVALTLISALVGMFVRYKRGDITPYGAKK